MAESFTRLAAALASRERPELVGRYTHMGSDERAQAV
jgi:hypothetical protein